MQAGVNHLVRRRAPAAVLLFGFSAILVGAGGILVGFHIWVRHSCAPDWRVPGASTRCSGRFTEKTFSKIERGMTEIEVAKLLGPPLKITEISNGRIKRMIDYEGASVKTTSFPDLKHGDSSPLTERVYYYTLQGDPTSAWLVRVITFDAYGITKRVTRSVYFD